jgi:PAS domain S-box-containing protein
MEITQKSYSWNLSALEPRLRIGLLAIGVAALCFLAARLGGQLEILPQADWPFWPANVLMVALLLMVPRRQWPLLMTAALATFVTFNLQKGLPYLSIFWLALSDVVEILTATLGLQYVFKGLPQINSLKSLTKYSIFAGVLAPASGAIFGALATHGSYWTSWRISFFSEAIAYFTILPAFLGWAGQLRGKTILSRRSYLEAAGLTAAILALSFIAFTTPWAITMPAVLFFLVPFLLWSALRFGTAGAGLAGTIVAFLSVWGAAHGKGPFGEAAPIDNVLWLQLFLISAAVPFMILAALVEGSHKDQQVLRESEKRFKLVADTAPVLIWMAGTDKLCNFFNQGWIKFTGRSFEEELGEGWLASVHPEDARRCRHTYSASFDSRVDFEMEYRMRRYDGEYRWMVDYGVPRFETDGTFCGYIGSCVDITERKTAAESVQNLAGSLIRVQEEERARIARELHDDFSQRLALLGIGLGQLWKSLPAADVKERAKIAEMLKETKDLSSDLHSLSHQLHSSRLEHVGLVSALSGLCKELSEKSKVSIHFTDCKLGRAVPKDVALCLFRVAQEGLGNVIKHSHASSGQVELGENANGLSLRIRDDGIGLPNYPKAPSTGLGLIGMQERVRLVGGRLLVRSAPMHGTEILAEVPLEAAVSEPKVRAAAAGM